MDLVNAIFDHMLKDDKCDRKTVLGLKDLYNKGEFTEDKILTMLKGQREGRLKDDTQAR